MATEDPNYDYLLRRVDELEQLLRANFLRAAYVSRGVTEFADQSTLRITDSNLEVVGQALITGWLRVIGRIVLEGLGILTVNGLIDLLGSMKVRTGGGITVEDGGDIDVIGGMIRAGLVRMEGGKLYIGDVVLDPATPNGGSLKFPGGPEVFASGSTLALYSVPIGAYIEIGATELKVRGPGIRGFTVDARGVKFDGVQTRSSTDGMRGWYGEDEDGYLAKVDPAVGGPMGNLSWPFPPSTVTSEYGPRESPGEGASTFHEGIDFGAANGTPIPAAGSGLVEFAGFDTDGGYGNYVLINHGNGIKTRSAHMNATPPVSVGSHVARGQIIGAVGDTGTSFGNHLHFEVEVNGVRVNPRSKLPAA